MSVTTWYIAVKIAMNPPSRVNYHCKPLSWQTVVTTGTYLLQHLHHQCHHTYPFSCRRWSRMAAFWRTRAMSKVEDHPQKVCLLLPPATLIAIFHSSTSCSQTFSRYLIATQNSDPVFTSLLYPILSLICFHFLHKSEHPCSSFVALLCVHKFEFSVRRKFSLLRFHCGFLRSVRDDRTLISLSVVDWNYVGE